MQQVKCLLIERLLTGWGLVSTAALLAESQHGQPSCCGFAG